MKHALIASTFAAALLSAGAMTGANAAENTQPAAQAQQVQTQAQTQVQVQAQPGPVAAQQGSVVSPVYEVPGRVNRAGSIYFGQ
ncbi:MULTISPECIES: hypothetical protein [Pandoraea]|uniref:hypothetical protein n=1 Tax=Pandoraea TaxID=93217 RepID=UPI001F5CE5D1|nr:MULTISPECIES: hypothetical protein [Pandoraea]MCI3207190.1 hypothetical protein [Pandoraea sp. LA3]MDN4585219.1 hypothetical protein [Pandoraea capi]